MSKHESAHMSEEKHMPECLSIRLSIYMSKHLPMIMALNMSIHMSTHSHQCTCARRDAININTYMSVHMSGQMAM